MRYPSIKFTFHNYIVECSYYTYLFDLLNNPTKLRPDLVPVGYCPGQELPFKATSEYLGLMVFDKKNNYEFWSHASPKQIGYVFGKEEEKKANQLCKGKENE